MIPPDFACHACRTRPIVADDLCAVCAGDAERSDAIQLDVDIDRNFAQFAAWVNRRLP